MERLLLIDAYALIYRAYYAFISHPRTNSKGENTSAVFGFVVTLEDLLRRVQPAYVGVAFDPKGKTFRHEAYPAYKAQRQAAPEDIHRAVPIIKQILGAMHIQAVEVSGFEADDVIGTLSHQAAKDGLEVLMATPDKDYGQLVGGHIYQYRPRHSGGFEQMGEKEVCDKYGLKEPKQMIDLLALMGDASDNIPGCKGVGEKTAVQLIEQFGSVANLLEHTDELKGALQKKVESGKEDISFSYFLATIRLDVPVEWKKSDYRYTGEWDWQALETLYKELEFNSLLKKSQQKDASSVAGKSVGESADRTKKATAASGMIDMFGEESFSSSASIDAKSYDTIENRLCAYLLNPERAFNPYVEPDWSALKADSALWSLYEDVELPLVDVLRDMESAGVRFDVNLLREAEKSLSGELEGIENDIYTLVGHSFNVNSPSQVGEVLFEQLRLDPKAKRGKTGKFSTSEEVLVALKSKHPVIEKILEQRELKKLISTYVSALPSYINPQTGKIHTHYNQTVTATGRLSSSNPNLQNLPVRTERGQLLRRAVIADEGCKFLSADYSQIELRLMAHLSGDEHITEAFLSGQDVHAATAAKIFHKPIESVTKEERRRAKTANFGIIYGISSFGLSEQLGCSRAEAKALIDDYFAAFPGIRAYIERQKQSAREQGYVETLFGRKRYLPDILSKNAVVRAFAERNAVNAPVQGTAADIIKMAMVAIHRELKALGDPRIQMIMQVHDELNFNVPLSYVEQVKTIVVEQMQNVVHLSVPLIVDCGVGDNWLEAH